MRAGDFTVPGSLTACPGQRGHGEGPPLHSGLSCFHLGILAPSSFMVKKSTVALLPRARLYQPDMTYTLFQGPTFTRRKLSPKPRHWDSGAGLTKLVFVTSDNPAVQREHGQARQGHRPGPGTDLRGEVKPDGRCSRHPGQAHPGP